MNSWTESVLSTPESSAEVRLRHWCNNLPWPIHSWHIHQSDPGCLQGATPPDCDRPPRWPSATHRGLLRQHSHHCPVQHWFTTEIRGHCHPLQQQGEFSWNVRNNGAVSGGGGNVRSASLHTVRARHCPVCAVLGVGCVLNWKLSLLSSSLCHTGVVIEVLQHKHFQLTPCIYVMDTAILPELNFHSLVLWLLQGHHSVGLMWWMLAREVLRMRGTISREHPWEVMPDLYFYRDPEEVRFVTWTVN